MPDILRKTGKWSKVADTPDHFVEPGMNIDFFDKGIVFKVVGGDQFQVRDAASVEDALDVFDPERSVVADSVDLVVLDVLKVFGFPAYDDVAVDDEGFHAVAVDGEGHQPGAAQAGEGEIIQVFTPEAVDIDRRAGKGLGGGKEDVAVIALFCGFGHGFGQIEPEGGAETVQHIGFIDAIFPTEPARLGVIDDPFVAVVQKGANDMAVSPVAQDLLGKIAHTLAVPIVFHNNAPCFQHIESPDKSII